MTKQAERIGTAGIYRVTDKNDNGWVGFLVAGVVVLILLGLFA